MDEFSALNTESKFEILENKETVLITTSYDEWLSKPILLILEQDVRRVLRRKIENLGIKYMLAPTGIDEGNSVAAKSRKLDAIYNIDYDLELLVEAISKFDYLYEINLSPSLMQIQLEAETFKPTDKIIYSRPYFIIRGVMKDGY